MTYYAVEYLNRDGWVMDSRTWNDLNKLQGLVRAWQNFDPTGRYRIIKMTREVLDTPPGS